MKQIIQTICISLLFVGPCFCQVAQRVFTITVEHRTANVRYAGTNDSFELVLKKADGSFVYCRRTFTNFPHNERERRGNDIYQFDVRGCGVDRGQVIADNVFIATRGNNAWLPSNMIVVGVLEDGNRYYIIERNWPNTNWFSGDPNDWSGTVNAVSREWPVSAPPTARID